MIGRYWQIIAVSQAQPLPCYFIGTQPFSLAYVLPVAVPSRTAELSSYDRDHVAAPKVITFLALYRKSLLTLHQMDTVFCNTKYDSLIH